MPRKVNRPSFRGLPSWSEVVAARGDNGYGLDISVVPPKESKDLRIAYMRLRCKRVAFTRMSYVCANLMRGDELRHALRKAGVSRFTLRTWYRNYAPDGLPRMVYAAQNGTYTGQPMEHWQREQREWDERVRRVSAERSERSEISERQAARAAQE